MRGCLRTIACLVALAWSSQAATLIFTGDLAPEAPGATGSGTAVVTYDDVAHTLDIETSWSGLSGTTTVAHIHCCTVPPGTASVAVTPGTLPGFPVGLMAGSYFTVPPIDLTNPASYTMGFFNGPGGGTAAGAEAAIIQGLLDGQAYLNIHTSTFGSGEIRDFLQVVPEPGTYALFAAGFAALAGYMLRRPRLS